jgi:hypothetical protein
LLVTLVLAGLGWLETHVALRATHSRLQIHAKPETSTLEELETLVRRTGLDLTRIESRRENVDLVIELEVRGPKRLHDQAMIAILHHAGVRSVSTGE